VINSDHGLKTWTRCSEMLIHDKVLHLHYAIIKLTQTIMQTFHYNTKSSLIVNGILMLTISSFCNLFWC